MKASGKITEMKVSNGEGSQGPWVRTSFTIDERKFSTFDKDAGDFFKIGDEIELLYSKSKDGKYSNISKMWVKGDPEAPNTYGEEEETTTQKEIEVVKMSENPSNIWKEKDLRIAKMNAVTNATKMLEVIGVPDKSTKDEVWEIVKGIAKEIVKYIYE